MQYHVGTLRYAYVFLHLGCVWLHDLFHFTRTMSPGFQFLLRPGSVGSFQAINKTAARAPATFVVFIGKLLKSFSLGDIGPWSYASVCERFPDQLHENFVVERF